MHCWFVAGLNEGWGTDMDKADLDLGVAANPEVDLGRGPDAIGVLEEELGAGGGEGCRLDGEGVGSDEVEGQALHGWVRGEVPKATAGTWLKTD